MSIQRRNKLHQYERIWGLRVSRKKIGGRIKLYEHTSAGTSQCACRLLSVLVSRRKALLEIVSEPDGHHFFCKRSAKKRRSPISLVAQNKKVPLRCDINQRFRQTHLSVQAVCDTPIARALRGVYLMKDIPVNDSPQ